MENTIINKYTLLLLSALQATNVFASASSSYPAAGASSQWKKQLLVKSLRGNTLHIEVSSGATGQQFEELASQEFGEEGLIILAGKAIDAFKPIDFELYKASGRINFIPIKLPTSESLAQHAQSNPEYASLLSVMDAIENRDWSMAHRRFDQLDQAIKDNEKFGKPIAALLARRK